MLRGLFYSLFSICLLVGISPASAAGAKAKAGTKSVEVWVRVIDKVTSKQHLLKAVTGSVMNYKTLSIMPHRCSVNNEGEFAALLEIYDQPPSGSVEEIFSGWMFSASVSLTSIEHPFYDVSLVKCAPKKEKAEEKKSDKKN